jgi:hypothetical protein
MFDLGKAQVVGHHVCDLRLSVVLEDHTGVLVEDGLELVC